MIRVRGRDLRLTGATLALAMVATACANGDSGDGAAAADGGSAETSEANSDGAEPTHLRVATSLPPGGSMMGQIEWYLEELEARTDGAITSEISYGGSLLSSGDIVPGLGDGRAEAGLVVPAYHVDTMPLYNLVFVSTQDNQGARSVALQDLYDNNELLRAEIEEDNGIHMVGFLGNSSQAAATAEPVESIDDLADRRIRIPGYPASGWQELGVEPVMFAVEEIFEGLQRGVLDGVTYPFDTHASTGVYEHAPYLFPDIGESGNAAFGISNEVYESLPEDVHAVMDELAAEWYDELVAGMMDADEAACDEMLDAGVTIQLWDENEQQQVTDGVGDAIMDAWKTDVTASGYSEDDADDVWNEYIGYVEDHTDTVEYESGLRRCADRQ